MPEGNITCGSFRIRLPAENTQTTTALLFIVVVILRLNNLHFSLVCVVKDLTKAYFTDTFAIKTHFFQIQFRFIYSYVLKKHLSGLNVASYSNHFI